MKLRFTLRARAVPLVLPVALLMASGLAHAVNPNANEEQKTTVNRELRYWSVDTLFETHFTVIRDNEYSNDVYHLLYLRGNLNLPRMGGLPSLGRLSLRLSARRNYMADPGESGFLFGDIDLYWSRQFSVSVSGQKFGVRPYLYWTFPTSRESRQQGNIARPTFLVALSKKLPLNLHAYVRPYARVNWHRYSSRGGDDVKGGGPNTRWLLGYDVQLLYTLHLHDRVSMGASLGQEFVNYYGGVTGADQPWQQFYFWEAFFGYTFLKKEPNLGAFVTLTSGRPVYEGGVPRFHFFDRDETEVYLTLNASY